MESQMPLGHVSLNLKRLVMAGRLTSCKTTLRATVVYHLTLIVRGEQKSSVVWKEPRQGLTYMTNDGQTP
jgi:hypothetical protein